jgi:hypothetical protein
MRLLESYWQMLGNPIAWDSDADTNYKKGG